MIGCEALAGIALFACLARNPACLPLRPDDELRVFLPAIARHESGFRPYAVRDEDARQGRGESLYFATHAEAVRAAIQRHDRGHRLGLGLFQITGTANWYRHGFAPAGQAHAAIARGLQPCANMRAGAAHYAADLEAAKAAARYNSGRLVNPPAQSIAYAGRVVADGRRMQSALGVVTPALPPPVPHNPCPGAPPAWDGWGTVRHAALCERMARIAIADPTRTTAP